jgi:hypothetical protein
MMITTTAVMLAASAIGAEYRPVVGEPHVDFVLPDIDSREPVALSDFRGKKTILIHFASW